jgi:hypothetical protein
MAEIKPLKLTSIGGGEGKLEEFAASDTLPSAIVGLGNVDDTSDASKPVSSAQADALSGKEPAIPLDVVSKFWSGTKAWRDLAADVRASALTGLSTATSAAVVAADSVLAAFGKIQGRLNLLGTAANANVQALTTDTTVGRVMVNGAHGLGTNNQVTSTGDLNDLRYGSITAPVNQLNQPTIEGVLWAGGRGAGARASQIFVDHSGGMYTRGYNSGRGVGFEWSAWNQGWGSLASNSITVDTGSFGYGTGSGGTVTQATSKTTGVTLNKPSGRITATADSLAANTAVSFTLTNSRIAASDTLSVNIISGATAGAYVVQVDAAAAGSCRISIRNMTAGALAEAIVMQFNVIKGAIA